MVGFDQPYLYEAVKNDERFPTKPFDPKSVTRASWESKQKPKKPNGPLVTINRHPDAHMVPTGRTMNYKPMGRKTKSWIKGMRVVQLVLRVLELIGAVGILVVMIFIDNIEPLAGWIVRITLGVVMLHCVYGIYHLSRPAGRRTPGSSAAYHVFAGVSDLASLPLYAYGFIAARDHGNTDWTLRINNQALLKAYFVPTVYYGLLGAMGLHLVSLAISAWLGVMFRRITQMPPDMNPLESHLTARTHKRNKSSVAISSYAGSEMRMGTPLEERRRSGVPYQDLSRPPSVPFLHTRQGSQDSRLDLPSRQYQVSPSNSPRNSVNSQDLKQMSAQDLKRMSAPSRYMEIPLGETGASNSRPSSLYSSGRPSNGRPSTGTVASFKAEPVVPATQTAQPRAAKFTEAWYASESLVQRTQQRNRAMNVPSPATAAKRNTYEAVPVRYDLDASDSENENENDYAATRPAPSLKKFSPTNENELDSDSGNGAHPNPLRSNPAPRPRPRTPFGRLRSSKLSDINLNDRRVSGSEDITDSKLTTTPSTTWQQRNRDSSIQPESAFYSKPYGDLRPATPPVIVGTNRQVSSGIDYDLGVSSSSASSFGRRHVSGKAAEEGRAGGGGENNRWSRYSALNQ
ncbi:hypothetical protein B0H63DRAFT_557893 [Podospora didyma]|uniref:Uncharacterized protein n=1 Tax=Podospora didyma TaxID=330526 RepID=A0AAE0U4U5_9PEZI|nr:hypothetical protein B0H63DRAFT_557893 [Podospora didyma]